jgi:DNA-binding CsgD family transcriptional regulator
MLSVGALRALGLTGRQAEALRWLSLGYRPLQAAAEMGIARRTLDTHIQHVYAKLSARTLSQATAMAWAAVGVEHAG